MRAALAALLSHWRRSPLQLAMLLLGLALATALWSGVQAINAEARASYAEAAATLGQDRLSRIAADGPVPQETYVALRRAGWRVSPVVEERLRIDERRSLRLIGIDPLTLPAPAQQVEFGEGDALLPFLTAPGLIFADPETLARMEGADLPPLRAAEGLPPGIGLMDIGQAQRLLGMEGRISHLLLDPEAPQPGPLPDGLRLVSPDSESDVARLTDSFHLNLTAFGLLSFAVGLFIVHSAIGLAFEQRRPMFRTLRALGVTARTLIGLLFAELLLFALLAGAAGLLLGYLVAALLLPDVAATLRGLYGAEVPGTLAFRPGWAAAGLGIALLGTLVSSAQSLWRVAHLPLLAPAQPRAWAVASERALWRQAMAAVGLLILAGALLLWGRGIVAAFVLLAALLLGAALLLPVLLAALLRGAQGLARGPIAQWFWADTRQQLPGLSLALMALLLALAANIGVGTMVSSFRLTFTGWLDQRLAFELYLSAPDQETADRVVRWLEPRAEAVLPIVRAETEVRGQPAQLYGMADHPTYRENWPLLAEAPGVWDLLAGGGWALVNEQLARREGLEPGDPIRLPGWEGRIAAVYSDYGNPSAQVILGLDRFFALHPDAERRRYGIRVAPDRAAALAEEMRAAFDLGDEGLIDQASLKGFSLQVFERTFAVTAALNVLTLGVAGLAMFASLMVLSGMRLPQLAPVWAMGLTKARLARLEMLRTLLLAAGTMAAALPLGLALAWVLLAVVNVQAFGWRLPMHVFPLDWLTLGALALVAAALAATVPVRRLARLRPADLLRVFANER
ncbi:FtsX-like permease family protein [Cereibacter johrii]|uniref:ABC transport system permease protein n=1 Tax=Cereibacter johrii TaxID=445629 RepID=A0ABX5J6C6_9RHOB|nr:FtsX-like permease family protein [Cereibacter johrii]ODM44318.1 ABC transporter permease [Cereibacter johrii]PTM76203.1 putative ABC transport system permease protein [Cereibacter johrii]